MTLKKIYINSFSVLVAMFLASADMAKAEGGPAGFLLGGATAGKRRGLTYGGGLGLVISEGSSISGVTYTIARRQSVPAVSYQELGVGTLVYFFPLYMGMGIRKVDGYGEGKQVSIGAGFGPVLLVFRTFDENGSQGHEVSLAAIIPIAAF